MHEVDNATRAMAREIALALVRQELEHLLHRPATHAPEEMFPETFEERAFVEEDRIAAETTPETVEQEDRSEATNGNGNGGVTHPEDWHTSPAVNINVSALFRAIADQDLNISDAAERCGVSAGSLYRMRRNGEVSGSTEATLKRLAAGLEIDPESIAVREREEVLAGA